MILFDLRGFGLRLAAGAYSGRLCVWAGERLIYSEGSMDSKAIRIAEYLCMTVLACGFVWLVVQVFCLALADMSAADVWRR